ncbi:MAG: aldo/keto reductase [Chloracidobacterium sp.]|uniref:Aldo/keto reductase n=1 Tax=Chloracidobacterium validum TaxID=2821543 RepID=A0ABX8B7U6_9BACT|nr:aldo/keto reductase [Chloracidobacterium validum]QUW02522.1 aldo/keto reductase [Chloracidobacterium validum]
MASAFEKMPFGDTGLRVSRIGLGSSYGIGAREVEAAYERGINYLYWGSIQRPDFGKAIRRLAARDRENLVVVVQTYTRVGFLMKPALESALRELDTDYTDILLLGWWNAVPPRRILDAALRLKAAGRARAIMISCHERRMFKSFIDDPAFDAIMVRYNAAHPGAEAEVFPHLRQRRVGVTAYTATRWGSLLDSRLTPKGERTPSAADCYRFVLTSPHVDVCLAGPKDAAELEAAFTALEQGPMSDEELSWMKRVGAAVREHHRQPWLARFVSDLTS